MITQEEKPAYRVPSMTEIALIPWNGLNVCSVFSGTGGSCLGYRMAGFKIIWANEFVPIAQASYRANAGAGSFLDGRDIREILATDILNATGLHVGELDILDGSPPCQAFSMAGKRAKGWGTEKRYEHGVRQKNETLFTEYIRLVRDLQPKVFVAENVSGLVKGVAKGFFKEILRDLKACGYVVEARLLDAQWLGVPQQRQRIIFQGVRTDLHRLPAWPTPLPYRYSVAEALPWLAGITNPAHGFTQANEFDMAQPASCVPASGGSSYPCPVITNGIEGLNSYHYQVTYYEGGTRPQTNVTTKPAPTEWSERAGTLFIEGANGFNGHAEMPIDGPMPTVQAGRPVDVIHRPASRRAYRDPRGCFGDAGEITDVPCPPELAGSVGTHWIEEATSKLVAPSRRGGHGYHAQDVRPDQPCGTVTTASPGNDLPVPMGTERRKFTIAELKRICAFPDDFVLVGSYSQRWERLGNAVPPVMMYHLATAIRAHIFEEGIS